MMNTERNEINIAIIGVVSAGKSTLTNALFVEQFSDMHIKRTTTLPQVYYEVDDPDSMSDLSTIRESNRTINKKMMDDSINNKLNINDIKEIKYYVPKVFDLIKMLKKEVYLTIHDMPGLNDGLTKDVYHAYTEQNFYKYDIIIFVIDINSGLNTSDETDILKLILKNMKINKEKYDIDNKLIILLNKCDDMECDKTGNCEPLDEELIDMKNQVDGIVTALKIDIYNEAETHILCISSEDAYIYRMYKKNPKCELDTKYLNKFGANEFGKSRWNRLSEKKKKSEIIKLFKKYDYTESIKLSGFTGLKQILNKILSDDNQFTYLMNHIKYSISNIQSNFTLEPKRVIEVFQMYFTKIVQLEEKYIDHDNLKKKNYNISSLVIKLDEYIKSIKQEFNTIIQDDGGFQESYLEQYLDYYMLYNLIFKNSAEKETEMSKYVENSIEQIKINILNYSIKCLKNKDISIDSLKSHIDILISYGSKEYNISQNIANIYDVLCNIISFKSFQNISNIMPYMLKIFKKINLSIDQQIECLISNIMFNIRNVSNEVINFLSKYYFTSSFKYIHEINYIKNIGSVVYEDYYTFKIYYLQSDENNIYSMDNLVLELISIFLEHYPSYIHNMDDIVKYTKDKHEEVKLDKQKETKYENSDKYVEVVNDESEYDESDDIGLSEEIDNELNSEDEKSDTEECKQVLIKKNLVKTNSISSVKSKQL
jgi:GTPase Era involved in 16S rRNA processing